MTKYFADRTGRGIRIGIIDSGIHAGHPHVGKVAGGVAIGPGGEPHSDYVDRIGHGTAVAAAIREKVPQAELFAIKVFDQRLATAADCLIRGIRWAAARNLHLANLSLGTTDESSHPPLQEAVAAAASSGLVLLAAAPQSGVAWLPGSLPGVLPVLLDWDCPRFEYRVRRTPDGGTMMITSGYPRDIPGIPRERNLRGVSFAVANATGFAARALETCPDAGLNDLLMLLAQSC